jgi:hypothetical protein
MNSRLSRTVYSEGSSTALNQAISAPALPAPAPVKARTIEFLDQTVADFS